jgi:hypothetical protein
MYEVKVRVGNADTGPSVIGFAPDADGAAQLIGRWIMSNRLYPIREVTSREMEQGEVEALRAIYAPLFSAMPRSG